MKPARWHQIEHLYHKALEMEESQRTAFLREACSGDEELRQDVDRLLAEELQIGSFLEKPALAKIAYEFAATAAPSWVGRQIGSYQFLSLLGSGGMGEVYRARDSKLKRDVAIKVLPDEFSRDPERVSRFQREAEVLASLNHPHIAAIYDLAQFGESRFLVLELVEGETLAERLCRGPVPLDEALRIAKQIAEALEAAHEKGIIHRDLKPANIKITLQGDVKVLDFGLARVLETEGAHLSSTPTKMTTSRPGSLLGTAAYMSPEQARGENAEKVSDVWAFGCVLYELLTGHHVFEGETIGEILGGIFKTEPDWHRLPAETPDGIRRLLRRCLQKDQRFRFRDIRDARLEIDDVQGGLHMGSDAVRSTPRRKERLAWISAVAVSVLIAAVATVRAVRPTVAIAPEARLEITTPPTVNSTMEISPDGLKIVFAVKSAGQSQLWLRKLDSEVARPLRGTEGGYSLFWSPDSRSIGFFADSLLKRVDIDGGSVQTLSSAPAGLGGAWNHDGTILFSAAPGSPIFRIPAGGGERAAVTRFDPQQAGHFFPRFLAGDRHFLFFVTGRLEARGVYIGNLEGLETKRLFDADTPAVYTAAGYLLFVREGKLLAQDFDPVRLEPKGDPFAVAEHVNRGTVLSASAAGPVAYRRPSPESGQRNLVWIDRSGREMDKVVYSEGTASQGPSLSHDGKRVAVFSNKDGNMDIWAYETEHRTWARITSDPNDDIFPLWSPDDSRIVFGSNRKADNQNLYIKLLSAAGSEELLLSTSNYKFPMDWSLDGRFLLYELINDQKNFDIRALKMDGTRTSLEVANGEFNERLPQFSPDGKWVAYQSDRTGRFEIYVQPFPGPGGASPISINGGQQVRWNPNGKELFYIAPDDRLMSVPIRFTPDGKTLEAGTPLTLFVTNVGSTAPNLNRQQYMVSPNGQSFVMNSVPEAAASPITVILNWKPRP